MGNNIINMIIKTFTINFLSYYIFFVIINKRINTFTKLLFVVFLSIITTAIYIYLNLYIDKIGVIIIIFLLQLFFLKMIVKNYKNTMTAENLIANAIEYSFYTLSSFIEVIPKSILKINNEQIDFILISLINTFFVIKLSNIKRIKNGFSFLQEKLENEYLDIIMINISAVVLLGYCLFGNYYGDVTEQILLTFIVITVIMFLLIQKTLTLYYKQKLLHQTIEDYKTEIADKDKKIKELSDEKYKISKLNHEFYNRQKALEKKVADYISNVSVETANELAITEQIADLSKEYSDKLQNIKHPDKLPTTEIEEIDDMFKYMQSECEKNNIEFKLQINGNIHHMINQIIPKDKLVTLIGDHLRDAIIAINSSHNSFRSIIAILGKADEFYEFCVFDTGIEFELETLLVLGTKPITTHKDTGGTGYGFMTTFETLRETKGSLVIEEKHKMSENDYTKAVRIIFDGKAQYRISSYRMKEQNKSIL